MTKRNQGRPLTYAPASPDTTPENTRTLEDRTIPDPDDETCSYIGHMTTFENPASPDTSPPGNTESKSVSEASEYNAEINNVASEYNAEINNVTPKKEVKFKLSNIEKKLCETMNNNSNVGDMKHLIELSETLPPSQFGFCTECANLNKVCDSGKASRVLQWVDETRKYKYERGEDEIQLSINLLKELDPLQDMDE